MKQTKIIAHRGASSICPENTLPAFQKALGLHADGIELDIHMTQDHVLVVAHDERIDRVSNGKGMIRDYTLKELKSFDFGGWFGPEYTNVSLPTLEEVLELIHDWDGLLNIELKSGPIFYPGIEQAVLNMVRQHNKEDQVIYSSFNHYSLREIKQIDPTAHIGLLYMTGLVEPWRYATFMKAEALHPLHYNIIPEMVKGCKAHHIALHPYTVDREEDIQALLQLQVDGIITNKPDVALQIRDKGGLLHETGL